MRMLTTLLAMIVVLLSIIIYQFYAFQRDHSKQITIGYVNVATVFKTCPAYFSARSTLATQSETIRAQFKNDEQQIRQDTMKYDELAINSDERNKLGKELTVRRERLREKERLHQIENGLAVQKVQFQLYEAIRTEAKKLAEEQGLQMVANYDESKPNPLVAQEILKIYVNQPFVYYQHDLTQELLNRLKDLKIDVPQLKEPVLPVQ